VFADWLSSTSLAVAKPALTALVLPPTPLLLLVLAGAWRLRRGRRGGFALVLAACAGLWLCTCDGFAGWLQDSILRPPPALDAAARAELRRQAAAGTALAIVVLGGGVDPFAPEFGEGDLKPPSLQRLRYGLWLGRETGVPVAMSGGAGWTLGNGNERSEAAVGERVAVRDFGAPLRWTEEGSRDTRGNARNTIALLQKQGVREIVLVTHGWHMPRALREFRAAAADAGAAAPVIVAAPMGLAPRAERPLLQWMPSGGGALNCTLMLREIAGGLLAPSP